MACPLGMGLGIRLWPGACWDVASYLSVFLLIPGLADMHVARVTTVHNSRISVEADRALFWLCLVFSTPVEMSWLWWTVRGLVKEGCTVVVTKKVGRTRDWGRSETFPNQISVK